MAAALALLITAGLAAAPSPQTPPVPSVPSVNGAKATEGCVVCHGSENRRFELSVHAGSGIGCVTCHGGDPVPLEKDLAHADSLRALSEPRAAVEECASCHSDLDQMRGFGLRTDQASLYWTSLHGVRLAADGAADVATCTTCHGAHGTLKPTDPRSPVHKSNQPDTCGRCHADPAQMEPYGLAHTVVDEYRQSVHGRALLEQGLRSSPSCTDCHGSHGATPPRVTEVGRVCGHCHSVVQGFFEESPHMDAVLDGAMEECIGCHGSHAIGGNSEEMFDGRGSGNCTTCHLTDDEPARLLAAELYEDLSAFDASLTQAEEDVRVAATQGLLIQYEHGYLDDARGLRARARSVTHALSVERLADLMNRGQAMIDQAYESVAVKRRALRDRKIFTALILGVTLLLAGVLQAYRKQVFVVRKDTSRARRGRRAEPEAQEHSSR